MPTYTAEQIAERQAAGIKMNKLNCGWNLPPDMRAAIIIRLNDFTPTTEAERRNKRILEYAFVNDMNAVAIYRLQDPEIIGMGNRSRGKPLDPKSIWQICMDFAPEVLEYRRSRPSKPITERRNALYKQRLQGTIKRPAACATCGSKKEIEQHHIIPLKAGGTDDYFNLISLCHDCHMKLHHTIYDRLLWKEQEQNP